MGLVSGLAEAVNTREDGLRLMLSILAGYPLSAIHRTFMYNKSAQTQHIFFVAVGIFLYWFNYGFYMYHALLSIVGVYAITNFLPGKKESVIAAHTFFLGHLLIGYWFAESDQYDITWTTPFCIMCLRFIGLVMDVYDGHNLKTLRKDQLETAISEPPGLLETAAYGLFFTGTMVGPLFSLSRFRAFVKGDYLDEEGNVRSSGLMSSLGRFVGGVTYLVLNQWGTVWIPDTYFASGEYLAMGFFRRWTWVVVWYKLTMMKYCAAWLITEGAAILNGIGYNGKDKTGADRWDGVRDLHVIKWELGHDFTSVVESFNCGTNSFAKKQVFRRLAWVGSKSFSHLSTLMYLALWHGYHLGYFVLFFYEFACVFAQGQLYSLIDKTPGWNEFNQKAFVRPFIWAFGKLVIMYSMGFTFLTFGLIKTKYWLGPIKSLYFVGYIFYFIVWPITHMVLRKVLPRKPREEKVEKVVDSTPVEGKKEL